MWRSELVKKLYLQDLPKLSQASVLASRELKEEVELAAAHVKQLVQEEAVVRGGRPGASLTAARPWEPSAGQARSA